MVATVTVSMSEDSEEDSGGVGVASSCSSSRLAAALRSSCRLSVLLLGSLLSAGRAAFSPFCVIGWQANNAALELVGAAMVCGLDDGCRAGGEVVSQRVEVKKGAWPQQQ